MSPFNPSKKNRNGPTGRIFASLLLVIAGLIWVCFLYRQQLYDWYKLWGYRPPAAIISLASQDSMNADTRRYFYVNHPQLLNTVDQFRADCPEDSQDIVLGCYHVGQEGIYIYNVQDPALAGVQQVTAAHEVLHSIYARLSKRDRVQLNTELAAYYASGRLDPRVAAEVAIYQKTEPGDVYDEMSCTFGTEIATLPKNLEEYYAQYFSNRTAIVHFEQQYQTEFTNRQTQVTADDQQLAREKIIITAEQNSLQAQLTHLLSEKNQMTTDQAANDISSYNAMVPIYNQAVDSYNAGILTLRQETSQYNQLVSTRNSIAGVLDSLDKAIDTRLSAE